MDGLSAGRRDADDLEGTMPKRGARSKALRDREPACPHDAKARLREAISKRGFLNEKVNDQARDLRIRFRFVLIAKVNGREELWTI